MPQLTIKTVACGREYSQEELSKIYIQRAYYTLHEMQKLGAVLLDERSKELSESGIDALAPEKVRDVLLSNKLRIGKKELNRLYDRQYRQADEMWRGILAASDGDYSRKVARAHLIVTGLNGRKLCRILGSALRMKKFLLSMNPDHIDASMTTVTEIMGMYGMPTEMKGTLKAEAPEPVDEAHSLRLIGASFLTRDPTLKNAVAMHQVRRFKGGLDILAGAYFPSAAPQELVDGHSIHMAIEFSNAFGCAL